MLKNQIDTALKTAMRAKDIATVTVIRSVTAAIKSQEINTRTELDEAQIMAIIEKQVKQRNESILAFNTANRLDLVEKEQFELAILKAFLPTPLTTAEVETIVAQAIADTGATSIKDMGKVMAVAREKTAGKADAAQLSILIKAALAAL